MSFFSRIARWRRSVAAPLVPARRAAPVPRSQALAESVEPRILYSADAIAGLLPAASSILAPDTGVTSDPSAAQASMVTPADAIETSDVRASAAAASPADSANVSAHATELVFVDPGVPDAQHLVDAIAARRPDAAFHIIELDPNRDGLTQITEALAGQREVAAIHIVSHGDPGAIELNGRRIDAAAIETDADQFTAWRAALGDQADLLIYGCDVAATPAGIAMLMRLAELTGADVAGSTDLTGSSDAGGDWTLEASIGAIQAGTLFADGDPAGWLGLLPGGFFPTGVPALNATASPAMPSILEGVTHPSGITVAALVVDGSITNGAVAGEAIAINALDTSLGTWQYSTDGGANWLTIDAAKINSSTNELALLLGPTASIRMLPFGDLNGTLTAAITFRAWGMASGASGDYVVITDPGDIALGSDFSGATDTASLTVTAVNDAPSGTSATLTTNEDTPWIFAASDFGFVDANDSPANALMAVTMSSLPTAGSLTLAGAAVTVGQSISITDINAGRLVFTPVTNANGTAYVSFTFRVQDNGGTTNGGVDLDPSAKTITFNVTAANDSPVLSVAGGPVSYTEGGPSSSIGTGVAIDDAELAALNNGAGNYDGASLTLERSGGANAEDVFSASGRMDFQSGNAVLYYDTGPVTVGTVTNAGGSLVITFNSNATQARVNDLLSSLFYANSSDAPPASVQIAWTFSDGNTSAQGSGGALTALGTTTVNITATNDRPVLNAAAIPTMPSLLEDATNPAGITVASLVVDGSITDPDGSPVEAIAITAVDASLGTWQYSTDGGKNWTNINTFLLNLGREALLLGPTASIRMLPSGDLNGTLSTAITFCAWDMSSGTQGSYFGTAIYGGAEASFALSAATNSASLVVTAVNDAPSGADNTLTTNEDTPWVFAATDFGFSDAKDTPANAFSAVRISSLATAGSLTLSGTAVTVGQSISVADIIAGRLVFTPVANTNGTASFTFRVQDNGGTVNGGVDLDPTAKTITFNVTAVNDAPTGANKTLTTNEDTAWVFAATDFGFSDAKDTPANAFMAVTVSSLPTAGSLTLAGTAVTAGQSISVADINAGRLVFTPVANTNGTTSFTFRVQDNGGTANGGVDLDSTAKTITFNVFAVNDAPSGADKTLTTTEGTPWVFAAVDFGFTGCQ